MNTGYNKWLVAMTAMMMLAGCGGGDKDLSGGGGNSDGGSTDNGTQTSSKISLTLKSCTDISVLSTCTNTASLPSERANLVEVLLVDSQSKPLAGEIVSVSTDLGSIKTARKQTDANGNAYFELNAESSTTEGAGIITAKYESSSSSSTTSATASQNFSFVPGQDTSDSYQLLMTLLSCDDLSDESTCEETRDLPTERASLVNVTLLSPAGKPVDGAIVTATASQGAIQPSSSRLGAVPFTCWWQSILAVS